MTKPEPLNDAKMIQFANLLIALKGEIAAFTANYKNHRGKVSRRHVQPEKIWCDVTDWHPKPGLMLTGVDLVKGVRREFRLADFDLDTLRPAAE